MILLLLTRFSPSEDLFGFQLSQILVQQGHHIYVTTTALGDALHEEIKNASDINIQSKGSVTLFSPEHGKHEKSSTDWITMHHKKYFSYLSKIDDIETVIGMLPGTDQTAIEIKESLKCRLILTAFSKGETNKGNLQMFTDMVSKADELWTIGFDIHHHYKSILQLSSTSVSIKHKEILLFPERKIAIGNKLVLSSYFHECEESLPEFLLCARLAKMGHHVYVTTVAAGSHLEAEVEKVKQLNEKYIGRIELLRPQHHRFETLSPNWIQCLPEQYFPYLSSYNVDCIFGTLPGTTETAVALKETLKCQVILIATCKLGDLEENMKRDIIDLVRSVDEVWSVGTDIHTHYTTVFHNKAEIKHKQIDLLPETDLEEHIEIQMKEAVKIVSVWNHPVELIFNGRKKRSKGSDIRGYNSLSRALSRYAKELQWCIHGLQVNDQKTLEIQNQARPNVVTVSNSSSKTFADNFPWSNYQVLIVPDVNEEMFNFFALTSIWLGIPTFVPSHSSVGKFLLSLPCPEASRAVVNLWGDLQHDSKVWIDKINTEIIEKEAKPTQWARALSEYLQISRQFHESYPLDSSLDQPWSQLITSKGEKQSTKQSYKERPQDYNNDNIQVHWIYMHIYKVILLHIKS